MYLVWAMFSKEIFVTVINSIWICYIIKLFNIKKYIFITLLGFKCFLLNKFLNIESLKNLVVNGLYDFPSMLLKYPNINWMLFRQMLGVLKINKADIMR